MERTISLSLRGPNVFNFTTDYRERNKSPAERKSGTGEGGGEVPRLLARSVALY